MQIEPDIEASDLIAHLNDHYDLGVTHVEFMPVGEGAWCYRANGTRPLFVRVAKHPMREGMFALLENLDRLDFPVIACIASRNGDFATRLGDAQLTVQHWFEATSLMKRNGPRGALHARIGAEAARLHASRIDIALPVEDFSRHQDRAQQVLDAEASGAFLALREAQRYEIELVLGAARRLGAHLRETSRERVVCHGDLHDDNVLVAGDGGLRIIDWDGAMYAPRERDLMFFLGDGWNDYMRGYGGGFEADQDILDYYIMEWALQEVVDYGGRILFDERFDAAGKADALRRFGALFEDGADVDRAVTLIRRRGA